MNIELSLIFFFSFISFQKCSPFSSHFGFFWIQIKGSWKLRCIYRCPLFHSHS